MCEINPKHSRFFRLEAFTSDPDITEADFEKQVMERVFHAEQQLNADGKFRFHIHETKDTRPRRTAWLDLSNDERKEAILRVSCPWCKQGVGLRCLNMPFHTARVKAAAKAVNSR